MRIERIDLKVVRLPLVRTFRTSSSSKDRIEHILVRVVADGVEGWGECASPSDPYYCPETTGTCWHILKDFLGPLAIGRDWATIDDLDMRLPTSIAHWHEHVDFCAPNPEEVRAGKVKIDGPSTARWLKITTREACDAAGGRFVPRIFGWMAHVYMFESEDPSVIWGGMGVHSHK